MKVPLPLPLSQARQIALYGDTKRGAHLRAFFASGIHTNFLTIRDK